MPMEELYCQDCDHCCNFVTFTLDKRTVDKFTMMDLAEYYKAHGFAVTEDTFSVFVTIHAPCKLKRKYPAKPGCAVHGTNAQPNYCKQYDCRKDRLLPPGGNYEKGKERP